MIDTNIFDALAYGFRCFEDVKSDKVDAIDGIDKVIFQDETTILIDENGKRYISRPESGEKFDEEKGLMVCLLKYMGISTSNVQTLLASARRKGSTEKKVDKVCRKKGQVKK